MFSKIICRRSITYYRSVIRNIYILFEFLEIQIIITFFAILQYIPSCLSQKKYARIVWLVKETLSAIVLQYNFEFRASLLKVENNIFFSILVLNLFISVQQNNMSTSSDVPTDAVVHTTYKCEEGAYIVLSILCTRESQTSFWAELEVHNLVYWFRYVICFGNNVLF